MASLQSSALRAAPGYAPRTSATTPLTPAVPSLGSLPTVPAIDDSRAPNSLARQLLAGQFAALTPQRNATLTGINAQARQAIAGYGGYTWGVDNPNTPENEGLALNYDASKGLGEKEKGALRGARDNANSAGMLESSFANQNIASAVQRMSLEGQQVATQYATALNQTYTDYANRTAELASTWAGYYGADSAWLVANPPPKPADIMSPYGSNLNGPGAEGDVWAGYHDPDPEQLAAMYPGMTFSYRTDPDGRVVVTARNAPQAAAPAAPAQTRVATPTSAAGSYPEWSGSTPPNLQTLAKAWGVPVGYVRVSRDSRTGKYTAWPQQAPPGPR